MPQVNQSHFLRPDELTDPHSFHYECRTPFGLMVQDIAVDVLPFMNHPEVIPAIGVELWRSTIATAINHSVTLDLMWYVRWRDAPLPNVVAPSSTVRGHLHLTPANKLHTVVMVMHTGHSDTYGARRLYLPSTPIAWQTDSMVNARGWDNLLPVAQGLRMGLAGGELGMDLLHLIAYPNIIDPVPGNLGGVLFRKVTHLKVMHYTERAPDYPGAIWP